MIKYYWHVHHNLLFEVLSEKSIQVRIDYIKRHKPREEIQLRLKLLHEAKLTPSLKGAITKARITLRKRAKTHDRLIASIKKLHSEQCFPNCPWNYENFLDSVFYGTIFTYLNPKTKEWDLKPESENGTTS